MLRGIGPVELGLILVIVLIVFGAGKIPQVGGVLGKGLREFRRASRGDYDDDGKTVDKAQSQSSEKAEKV
jgi:sec-independent protein translocase protein TatA